MRAARFVVALAFVATHVLAQGTPRLERILLPIFAEPTPGLFGSLWVSDLWVHNNDSEDVGFAPVGLSDWPGVPPRTTMRPPILPRAVGRQPGKFIWTLSEKASKLRFNLRVRDTSRPLEIVGTEIPVIRESQLFTATIVLLNVPSQEGFRCTLRVYQALNTGDIPGQVRVLFYSIDDGFGGPVRRNALAEQIMTLTPEGPPFEYVPGYAQFSFSSQLAPFSPLRIEVEPLSPSMRFWAFVTVTSDSTQQVTVVTPQ